MNKVFSFLKKYRRKIIFISIFLIIFVLIILFLFKTIYGSWWTIYPQRVKSFISLNRLAISVYEDPWCRLDCYLERQIYQQEIVKFMENDKFTEKIKRVILNEEENLSWRLELLKVLSLVENREDLIIFNDLQNYLNQANGNLAIKQAIAFYFSDETLEEYLDLLKNQLADDSYSIEERKVALKNLATLDISQADFYLALLELSSEDSFNIELLRALGSDEGRFSLNKEKLFFNLEKIILSSNSSFTSRRLAIFILSDFLDNEYEKFEDENFVESRVLDNLNGHALFKYLIANENTDIFSRYLLIDILNNNTETKIPLPEISSEEWGVYYAN
jgi:hypothetical protein